MAAYISEFKLTKNLCIKANDACQTSFKTDVKDIIPCDVLCINWKIINSWTQ